MRANIQNSINNNIEIPFSNQEWQEPLEKAKNKRTTGPEQISAEVIKNLTDTNRESLFAIFNKYWNRGVFPKVWNTAKIQIIRKAGNWDWSLTNSPSPISLLPTVGKECERLIAKRLISYVEETN